MGNYRPKSDEIIAIQLQHEARMWNVPNDYTDAKPGDWLISHPDGSQYFMTDEQFKKRYEPIPKISFSTNGQPLPFYPPGVRGSLVDAVPRVTRSANLPPPDPVYNGSCGSYTAHEQRQCMCFQSKAS